MLKENKDYLKNKEGIGGFDGNYYQPYNVLGLPHIGIGHLIKPGEHFDNLTYQDVMNLFDMDIEYFENIVNEKVNFLPQNCKDALTIFLFRTGAINSNLFGIVENSFPNLDPIIDWWSNHYRTAVNSNNPGFFDERIKEELDIFKKGLLPGNGINLFMIVLVGLIIYIIGRKKW